MKKSIVTFAMCMMALPAMAVLTLPIAEDATSEAGEMRVSAGVTIESDFNMYGGRFTYGLTDELSLFAGAGLADPDAFDSEPYFQVGGKYVLPVDMPVDLALRGGFGIVSFDEGGWELDIWMINAGLLASKAMDDNFTVYGFGGLSYSKTKVTAPRMWGGRSSSDTDSELAIAGGVLYAMDDNISFYAELAHIDDLFVSGGVRFKF